MDERRAVAIRDGSGLTAESKERISRYAKNVVSESTTATYSSGWRHWLEFCEERGYEPLPATVTSVADFLTMLADSGASISQIDMKRSAIRKTHLTAGHVSPTEHPQVIELMNGIRRTIKTAHTPKDELSLDQLSQIIASLPSDLRGKRDKALLLMGFWGAFRRSELVAVEMAHIRMTDGVMRVTIPTSKTDQTGKGKVKTMPTLPDDLGDVCPVRAYRTWMRAAALTNGFVFRPIDRWGNVGDDRKMDGKEVARITKRAVAVIGLEESQFAGHSLRRGFLTEATDAGAQSADMREQSGHETDETLKLYQAQRGRGSIRAIQAIVSRNLETNRN